MILQGRFNSVFTPNSLHDLTRNSKSNLYLVDEELNESTKTISIEYKCERKYVRWEKLRVERGFLPAKGDKNDEY